jgi:hypothetical protein
MIIRRVQWAVCSHNQPNFRNPKSAIRNEDDFGFKYSHPQMFLQMR